MSDGMTDPLQAYVSYVALVLTARALTDAGSALKVNSNPTTVLEVLDNVNGCDLELLDAVNVK
jgi:hypothetical protein